METINNKQSLVALKDKSKEELVSLVNTITLNLIDADNPDTIQVLTIALSKVKEEIIKRELH
jgi:hypothetical protein